MSKILPKSRSIVVATKILSDVMRFRRVPRSGAACGDMDCLCCIEQYLPVVLSAVDKGEAVTFVLPAFPGKSPNTHKVLGVLPDLAEQLSLDFLANLAKKIKCYYSPGIKIIICSDGRVFSDLIGIREADVSAYQVELIRMITASGYSDISCFHLDDYYHDMDFDGMREVLMHRYGESIDYLKFKVKAGGHEDTTVEQQDANRMYRGLTRFLFEDACYGREIESRTAVQKQARIKAYEVMRRSNAWTRLIAEHFPAAVRLSIHPQTCGSKKLGIRLVADECWMTPWHGVAVETNQGYVLMKRAEVEAMGAKLICFANGRSSHYQLTSDQPLQTEEVMYEL